MSIPRHLLLKAVAVASMAALLPLTSEAKAGAARLCDWSACVSTCDEIPPGICDSCFRPVACVSTGLLACPFVAYCDAETR